MPQIPSDYHQPDWDNPSKTHDWKNHVSHKVRLIWNTFTERQKRDLAEGFQDMADTEHWE